MSRAKVGLLVVAIVAIAGAIWWSTSGDGVRDADLPRLRWLGAAYFDEDRLGESKVELLRVLESPAATSQDFVNVATVVMAQDPDPTKPRHEEAMEYLGQAEVRGPVIAAIHYCRGILARRRGDEEAARQYFEQALALDPDDVPTRLHLAMSLERLERIEDATGHFEIILEGGVENGGAYYPTAVYRMAMLANRTRTDEGLARARELLAEKKALSEQGIEPGKPRDQEKGNLGRVQLLAPEGYEGPTAVAGAAPRFERIEEGLAAEAGAVSAVEASDLNGDGLPDLVILGSEGTFVAVQQPGATWVVSSVDPGTWPVARAANLAGADPPTKTQTIPKNDRDAREGSEALLLVGGAANQLLVPGEGWPPVRDAAGWPPQGFTDHSAELGEPFVADDLRFVDFDHEGDLDLLFTTATGLRLLRNDGREMPGYVERNQQPPGALVFTDITEVVGFGGDPFAWVLIEDFDADNDIDFLAGGPAATTTIISNLRRSQFERLGPDVSGLPATLERPPLLADLNHDGRADVLTGGAEPMFFANRGDGTYGAGRSLAHLATLLADGAATLADVDLDGEQDLVARRADGSAVMRLGSLLAPEGADVPLECSFAEGSGPLVLDIDRDCDVDLVGVAAGGGLEIWRGADGDLGNGLRVELIGIQDARQPIGVLVEVREGERYQRLLYQGEEMLIGLGEAALPDVLRITWANGVMQNVLNYCWWDPVVPVEPDKEPRIFLASGTCELNRLPQKQGDPGSCPFLYGWNGTTYEFITDVIGTTPLGLPMVEGQYVPPDHDELVRITDRQLVPVDGEYRLQVTEERREVCYLDRAQLWVVDHPADVEVHPEERFTFPPFPPQRIHAVREILPLAHATASDGRDWTGALATVDGEQAAPFTLLPDPFRGLTEPYDIDITLPDEVRTAEKVRLLMTGWLVWTNASINVATGHHPQYEFVPPTLLVPDDDGGWRSTGPPVGFPAGHTKTMVLDVTDILRRDDPRIRIHSTLRLYWDAIRVAVDSGDAETRVTKLEPIRADLHHRGFSGVSFSVRVDDDDARFDRPEQFDWDVIRPSPWDQHRGLLTRYGDVLPLLGEVDDRFALFSAGDAVDVRFDATAVPDLEPGMGRTYLLYLDGWAKDGDPNTVDAETVEPLPFHGMSGYPYGPDEAYPDTEEHRRYRAEWNTRPGRKLMPSLVPTRAVPGPRTSGG